MVEPETRYARGEGLRRLPGVRRWPPRSAVHHQLDDEPRRDVGGALAAHFCGGWARSRGWSATTSAAAASRIPCRWPHCRRSSSGRTTRAPPWTPRGRARRPARRHRGRSDGDGLRRHATPSASRRWCWSTATRASCATPAIRSACRPRPGPGSCRPLRAALGQHGGDPGPDRAVGASDAGFRRWFTRYQRLAMPRGAGDPVPLDHADRRALGLSSIRVPTLVIGRAGARHHRPEFPRYLSSRSRERATSSCPASTPIRSRSAAPPRCWTTWRSS